MYALVVDDDETSIILVESILAQMGYQVRVAHNGREALRMLDEQPAHLVITDWEMPEMSGIELCEAIRKGNYPGYVYIIMITGRNGDQQKIEGIMAGADNFLNKPLRPAELLVCLKTAERILSLETCELAIFALARLAESRDLETGAHVERVQKYAKVLATELAKGEKYKGTIDGEYVRLMYQTCPLHDIGKVGIPDAVLLKPGKLSERETAIMKTHAQIGAQTLDAALVRFPNAKFLRMARQIAASHHEKYDGTGYPQGLKGEEIPLCGRIVALADVYDALTSRRVYKPAMTHDQARTILVRESGSHFDPDVVTAFLACEGEFAAIMESLRDKEAPAAAPAKAEEPRATDRQLVLLVEDDAAQSETIASLLAENGFSVVAAPDAAAALTVLARHRPRVVISDWSMPGMDGADLCRRVRALDQVEYTFFLMLTMHTDKERMLAAFDAGVDDFLVKPFHQGELLARIRAGVRTIRLHDELQRRNQGMHELNGQLLRLNSKLERLAVTDELTGLYNRRQAMIRLQERAAHADRYGEPLSIALIDLDHFKRINDTHGHAAGDEVLRTAAAVLAANVRETDTVCRTGGEEFLIVFPAQTAAEAAISVERCRAAVAAHAFVADAGAGGGAEPRLAVTISGGVASYRKGLGGVEGMLVRADRALYAAKAAGRNRVEGAAREGQGAAVR
jgi:putative two-component system response regulator